jgi:hypothetical protein
MDGLSSKTMVIMRKEQANDQLILFAFTVSLGNTTKAASKRRETDIIPNF